MNKNEIELSEIILASNNERETLLLALRVFAAYAKPAEACPEPLAESLRGSS